MNLHPLLLFLHIAAVSIWIGGMFFAYVCLRPAAVAVLEPAPRLLLWRAVLGRFFSCLWIAVAVIAASGFGLFAGTAPPLHWLLMAGSGLLMMLIFGYAAGVAAPRLGAATAAAEWPAAAAALGVIRRLVGINLLLGALTIAFATLGRYLS